MSGDIMWSQQSSEKKKYNKCNS